MCLFKRPDTLSSMTFASCVLSCVQPLATPVHQAPLSMGFPRQNWSGLPFPPPRDLPGPGIDPSSLISPALAGRFFTTEPPGFLGATMLKIYTYVHGYLTNVSHSVDVWVMRVDTTAVFSLHLIPWIWCSAWNNVSPPQRPVKVWRVGWGRRRERRDRKPERGGEACSEAAGQCTFPS